MHIENIQAVELVAAMPMQSIAAASAAAQQHAAFSIADTADMLRTSDAWLGTIQNMMGHMSELAIRAGDGTLSNLDRSMLQREFSQMQYGIQSITTGPAAMGRYNDIPLFQGQTTTLPSNAAYATPDLTASSLVQLGSTATGAPLVWGDMFKTDTSTQAAAASALPAMNLGLNHLGSLRSELGVIWSLVSPNGSPLTPSATAAASLADSLQYTTFYQTLNALGSNTLLMQA